MREHVDHVDVDGFDLFNGTRKAAEIGHHDDGRYDERHAHERSLESVRPAYCQESADEHINDGCSRADPDSAFIAHVKGVFKKAGTGHNAARTIDREKHQNDDGRENAQHARIVLKAMREKVRKRQGIMRNFGVYAQAGCDELPIQIGTEREADCNPAFRDARKKHGAGQAHQQPAAHVGSADGKSRHNAAETTAAQNVVVEVAGVSPGDKAQDHHQNHVAGKSNGGRIRKHLFGSFCDWRRTVTSADSTLRRIFF